MKLRYGEKAIKLSLLEKNILGILNSREQKILVNPIVVIDAYGNNLYETEPPKYRK